MGDPEPAAEQLQPPTAAKCKGPICDRDAVAHGLCAVHRNQELMCIRRGAPVQLKPIQARRPRSTSTSTIPQLHAVQAPRPRASVVSISDDEWSAFESLCRVRGTTVDAEISRMIREDLNRALEALRAARDA